MNAPISLWIHGVDGRMGKALQTALSTDPLFTLKGGSSKAGSFLVKDNALHQSPTSMEKHWKEETVLDFSTAEGSKALINALENDSAGVRAVLLASTGVEENVRRRFQELASKKDVRVLEAPNTSIGILVLSQMASRIAEALAPLGYDLEVVETHHRDKKDAPSGTALLLAERLAKPLGYTVRHNRPGLRSSGEIGLTSVRGGGVVGEHEVRVLGEFEEIRLSHRAFSRDLFAKGALVLARWVRDQKSGFYTLENVRLEDLGKAR